MEPFCLACIDFLPQIIDCRKCSKWNAIKLKYAQLARRCAEAEKKLLLASQIIEQQVLNEQYNANRFRIFTPDNKIHIERK